MMNLFYLSAKLFLSWKILLKQKRFHWSIHLCYSLIFIWAFLQTVLVFINTYSLSTSQQDSSIFFMLFYILDITKSQLFSLSMLENLLRLMVYLFLFFSLIGCKFIQRIFRFFCLFYSSIMFYKVFFMRFSSVFVNR